MKIYRNLIVIIMAFLASPLAEGQVGFFNTCRRFPDDDNLSEKVIMKYNEKSSRYTARGDINGLEQCIEVMSDLNSYNLPITSADIKNQKGILNYYRNNNTAALKNYLSALEIFNSHGFTEGVNTLLNNIAIIFSRVEDYESTLKYLNKALEYTDKDNISSYSLLELNIAETETRLNNFEKSLEIAFRLYDQFDAKRYGYDLISVTGVIIDNYNKLGDFDKALEWIRMTPDSVFDGAGYMDLLSFCPQAMESYFNLSMYDKVFEKGALIYPPSDPAFMPDLYDALDLLSRASSKTGRFGQAIKYEEILREIEFSRTTISREDLITLLMTDYAFNIDNIARVNIERELFINNEKDRTLKRFILQFLLVIAVVSVLTVILIRTRRTRKNFKEELAEENNKLAQVNRELISNNKLLEKENSLLDTLISIFAHDLINPFQAILGFSKLMISDYDNIEEENICEYTSLLSDTSFQLNQLLINLRNMAVLQDENRNLESTLFTIEPVIRDVINLFTPLALKKNIEFKYSGDKSFSGYLNTDIFQSVIRNVISNAVKFSHEKGIIEIEVAGSTKESIVTIKDHGTGMPEEIRQKLISKEYLMSSPGTMMEKGSGLGLTICIELLERYNGRMEIASTRGTGTEIKVIIPATDD